MKVALVSVVVFCACSPRVHQAREPVTLRPIIDRVVPDSGPAGTAYPVRVTIMGRRFADSSNTVTFASVTVSDLPATAAGTRIELFLPKESPSPGEVAPPPLLPGEYDLTVTTEHGTSAPVRFTLTDPGRRG